SSADIFLPDTVRYGAKHHEVVDPQAVAAAVAQLDADIAYTNKYAPIILDDMTKIKNVSRTGLVTTFKYEVTVPASKWSEELRKGVTQLAVRADCVDYKNTRMLLDAGYSVRHVFTDQNGQPAYDVSITKDSC